MEDKQHDEYRRVDCALLPSMDAILSDERKNNNKKKKGTVRWPGVEPGSAAWKATMLTVTPPTRRVRKLPVD